MRDAREYADSLYHIMEAVDFADGGGNDVGCGINYKNDTFESRNYWSHEDCTCGLWELEEEVIGDRKHTCDVEEPGFRHYASGLEVSWYKRLGRSTESNKLVKPIEWYRIVIDCIESVKRDVEGRQ